jgi:hypothetical protein
MIEDAEKKGVLNLISIEPTLQILELIGIGCSLKGYKVL